MIPPPAVSVVITTYNRGPLLGDAIRSVLAQADEPDAPPFELIVADNNSSDDTRAILERLVPGSGGRLRYVFEPRQGASHGRNAGAAAARAPILAFTDDDVRAAPGWLAGIVRAFADHPWAEFVGGRVLPRWPGPVPTWLTPAHWGPLALIDYGDAPRRVDLNDPICLVTCNAAFRKSAFDRVGGFDPRFQHQPGAVTACEDQELELRIMRAGGAGLYLPELLIEAEVQPHRLTQAYHLRWSRDHGRAIVALLAPGTTFDGRGRPSSEPMRRHLFGVGFWAYRGLAEATLRSLAARVAGRPDEAFAYACAAAETRGYIEAASARWRRGERAA